MRHSIPTVYNGIRFRSKLEADWALAFDRLGVEWEYEKEGLQLEEVFYLPDFYLPRSRQHFEAKGRITDLDRRKVRALVKATSPRPWTDELSDIAIVMGFSGGEFLGYRRHQDGHLPRLVDLAQCVECNGWWFYDLVEGSWRCQCCGCGTASSQDHFKCPSISGALGFGNYFRNWPRVEAAS